MDSKINNRNIGKVIHRLADAVSQKSVEGKLPFLIEASEELEVMLNEVNVQDRCHLSDEVREWSSFFILFLREYSDSHASANLYKVITSKEQQWLNFLSLIKPKEGSPTYFYQLCNFVNVYNFHPEIYDVMFAFFAYRLIDGSTQDLGKIFNEFVADCEKLENED